ncbi:MAG: MFS transporter [Patescibacteria group bacterium]
MSKLSKKRLFITIYIATFLAAFHVFLMVYINSSFLSQFISEKAVSLLYIIGSLATIVALVVIPIILRRFGNYATLITFTILEFLILFAMAFVREATIIVPLFMAHWVVSQIMLINIDVFFESSQKKESDTGSKRAILLTIINLALILSILLVGFILKDDEFWKVYLMSAVILIPFLLIILIKFRKLKDPIYESHKILTTVKKVWKSKAIRNIFISQLFLKFFYSWMVVYMPIYLHEYVGFDWPTISIIFTIMLLPFILFEIPAGLLADKWCGEKELLSSGFIIIALFTMVIPFISIPSFIIWTAVLFVTRVGASIVEITTESYFFKHVQGDNADIISFFRMTHPFAYIAGPIIAIIALQLLPFQYIFLALGIIMFFGIYYALALEDTR